MDRIEFYKMSIEEYPNHKDKESLKNSVEFLQKEFNDLEKNYNEILTESEGLKDSGIEKDLAEMSKSIMLGRIYWSNPKSCAGCFYTSFFGYDHTCSYLFESVNTPRFETEVLKNCPTNKIN
jgi:hypothetical protein